MPNVCLYTSDATCPLRSGGSSGPKPISVSDGTARLAVRSGLDGIDLNANPSVLSAELVEWLHARRKVVAVWVWKAPASNDDPAVWQAMARRGVDFFTSNLPNEVHEWRRGAVSVS